MNPSDLQALIDQSGKLQADAAKRALKILESVRKDITGSIASTEWAASSLLSMRKAVEESIGSFKMEYIDAMDDGLADVWDSSAEGVAGMIAESGLTVSIPTPSISQLEILQGYSADLITNMAQDAIKRINTELTLGIMAGKSLNEVMDKIGRNLIDPSVFKTIATRAEMIARTETARVFSNSRQARINGVAEIMAEDYPGIKLYKQWIHSGKPNYRKNHKKLDKKVVALEDNFPGGFDYPHAPGMAAKEVIACGCVHVLLFPGMTGYPDKK